nr:MAG TPA: hypothetical protein [Caudoviricetes sp.]
MKINAEEFFQEATKAKIRKMLKCYKDSDPDPEAVKELKDWLWGEIQKEKDKVVRCATVTVSQRTTLKELEDQYDRMCSPSYAAYTEDKEKLAEAKKAMSRCRARVTSSSREYERAKKDTDRRMSILEIIEKIL